MPKILYMNKVKNIILVLTSLSFTILLSCCSKKIGLNPSGDKDVERIYNNFIFDSKLFDKSFDENNLMINVLPDDHFLIGNNGRCEIIEEYSFNNNSFKKNKIKIISLKKTFWEKELFFKKKILLYHELGHCLLEREHRDDELLVAKSSIMHSFIFDNFKYSYYELNWEYYLRELFLY